MTTNQTIDTEAFIRDRAAMGFSREMVRESLGIKDNKFRQILTVLPDVVWPAPGKSLGRKLYYETLKGHCPEWKRAALERGRATREAKWAVYNLCGVSASLTNHYRAWAEYVSVSRSQVDRRVKAGWPLYDAFFAPCTPLAERLKIALGNSPWSKKDEMP